MKDALYPAQTRKRTKKELPNSYIKLLTYLHPIVRFVQKTRAWSRSKSLQPITTLVQITHYTSPNYTDPPRWTYTVLHWIHRTFFHCSGFLSNLRLPWKIKFVLKIFTVLNIFFTIQDFWATLRLPWKTEFALKIFTVLNIHFTFRIFEQLALALKNRVALQFFTVSNYFLSFRIFEQLALALKTEFALKFFKPATF